MNVSSEKKYIIPSNYDIKSSDRALKSHCRPSVLWFTGLSGSGKSTISNLLDKKLYDLGVRSYFLDGDNLRSGLNKDLGFSDDDRVENIRRTAEVAKLFVDSGALVLCSFISPFTKSRAQVKDIVGADNFKEVFINTSLEECKSRDPKGLYKKALAGEIKQFTGIDSPYEAPEDPDLLISTDGRTPKECAEEVFQFLKTNHIVQI